jgi:hypothetical protein
MDLRDDSDLERHLVMLDLWDIADAAHGRLRDRVVSGRRLSLGELVAGGRQKIRASKNSISRS